MASKHGYEIVAKAIRKTLETSEATLPEHAFEEMVRNIADAFALDNIHFSRYRFMAACGYEPE